MSPSAESIRLTASQAACLEAIRQGLKSKTGVALHVKKDLKTVAAALAAVARAGLVEMPSHGVWRATPRGRDCTLDVVPDPKPRGPARGKIVPGSAAERLLALLDRPRRGRELVERLGVTPQRVHQLVIRFHAEGRVRIGDSKYVTYIVARSGDPSILLSRDEGRALSALPGEGSTTASRVRAASKFSSARSRAALSALQDKGLLERAGTHRTQVLYRLTPAGRGHFQRRRLSRVAAPAPLPVKSQRVQAVLTFMAEHGEVRTRDVGLALGIARQSMNALMQYLKRKGLARKAGRDLNAPHALTDAGKETLSAMTRRAAQQKNSV